MVTPPPLVFAEESEVADDSRIFLIFWNVMDVFIHISILMILHQMK